MNIFDEINKHKYISLLEIGETADWCLRLVIAEAIISDEYASVSEEEEPNEVMRQLINRSKPIGVTEASRVYEILFEDYITYSVINESYISEGDDEKYDGSLARIYTKSVFLEYVEKATFATQDYPGPFKHYGFCCGDHIVDVASVEPPTVRHLNFTSDRSDFN